MHDMEEIATLPCAGKSQFDVFIATTVHDYTHFSSSLELLTHLTVEESHTLARHLAFPKNHALGFNHMDVKPPNICIRENGDFILVNLGSIVHRERSYLSRQSWAHARGNCGRKFLT